MLSSPRPAHTSTSVHTSPPRPRRPRSIQEHLNAGDLTSAFAIVVDPQIDTITGDQLHAVAEALIKHDAVGNAGKVHDLVRRGQRDGSLTPTHRLSLRTLGGQHHPKAAWLRRLSS